MKKPVKDLDLYVIVTASGFSAVITILDFLGVLDEMPFFSNRIPTFTLLLVSIVLGYLVVERRSKLDVIENRVESGYQKLTGTLLEQTNRVIDGVRGVNIRLFEQREDVFIYLAQRVENADRSMFLTSVFLYQARQY